MLKTLWRILSIYRPWKKAVVGMFGFLALTQAISLVSPYIYGKIIDTVFVAKSAQDAIRTGLMYAFLWLAVNLARHGVHVLRNLFELKTFDYKVSQDVANKTMEKYLSFSIGQHHNQNSGVKQSIMRSGETALTRLAALISYQILPLAVQVFLSLAVLLYISLPLGLVVLAASIIVTALTITIGLKLKDDLAAHKDLWIENGKLGGEIFSNVDLIQANAQEKRVKNEYRQSLLKIAEFGIPMWTKETKLEAIRDTFISFTAFVVLAISFYFVANGEYTPGYLVMFLSWSSNTIGRLESVSQYQRQFMQDWTDIKKYFTLMDVEPDIKTVKNPIRVDFKGRIEFKDVSFRYPVRNYADMAETSNQAKQENVALNGISLVIEPGQKVAFVGHSGAGKTTLAYLLLRAYDPDKGQIIVDGNDLRLLDLNHFRESIGLVEQDVCLFDNTLRYNMTFGLNGKSSSVTEAQLFSIAKTAGIDQFFGTLEKGFDTIIGEDGVKLSGGERQRVGIARALIKDPKFLIFDEATSHLDSENEDLVRQAVRQASMGRTTIIIAHRLSTVRDADKIVVLEKGGIAGQGRHEELMHSCDAYQKLVNKQLVTI